LVVGDSVSFSVEALSVLIWIEVFKAAVENLVSSLIIVFARWLSFTKVRIPLMASREVLLV
jgi:hypothetical protein